MSHAWHSPHVRGPVTPPFRFSVSWQVMQPRWNAFWSACGDMWHNAQASEGSASTAMVDGSRMFFPFSKTLFLAFDLLFRPPTRDELVDPAGPSAPAR